MKAKFCEFEDWLDDVRAKLNEETKDMTNDEIARYFNTSGKEIAAEYGITRFKNSPESPVTILRHSPEIEKNAL